MIYDVTHNLLRLIAAIRRGVATGGNVIQHVQAMGSGWESIASVAGHARELPQNHGCGCKCGNPLAAAREAEAFGGGGLDADARGFDCQ